MCMCVGVRTRSHNSRQAHTAWQAVVALYRGLTTATMSVCASDSDGWRTKQEQRGLDGEGAQKKNGEGGVSID